MQPDAGPNRFVRSRAFAALLVMAAAWSLCLRLYHIAQRLWLPSHFLIVPPLSGSMGRVIDLATYLAMAALSLCLFAETRDRLDRLLLVACFAPVVLNPLKMLIPAYAAAIWWIELACSMAFVLTSIAVFLRLCRPAATNPDQLP